MDQKKYVTRRQGVELLNEQGYPITLGRINKDTADGCGPIPAGRYGPTFLYTPDEFLRYAEERIMRNVVDEAAA